jgi:UDP-glucuronate decarboxylase
VQLGHRVTVADSLLTGSLNNLLHLLEKGRVTFIRHDVTVPLDLEVDQIYNLACAASPVHYQADPIHTARTNALGALNLLELARRRGARILQSSTSEVYGDPEVHPQPESYWGHVNPAGLRSCYDEGKRFAETVFLDYARQYGVAVKIARIFNTYGPRMHPEDGRVVSNFVVQALRGEPLTIYGDGSQTRSFCYVDDLIDGLVRLMESPSGVTGPINLGNPVEFTVRNLAELVLAMTGSRSPLEFRPLPADDPRLRRPDIAQAWQQLNWRPVVALADGLQKTIDDFRSRLAGDCRRSASG